RVQPISFFFVAVPIMFAVVAGCDVLRLAADDGSCFPRLLKTLPLSNLALAAPLLGYAATVCAAVWAFALLVAWNVGSVDIVLARSGSMLLQLAALPWVLAAFWVPIERRWLRSARGAAVWAAFWISFNFGLDLRSMPAHTLV